MSASLYYRTVFIYTALPVAAATVVIGLLAISYLIRRREQQFLEFRAELVAIASHEIRTPLTGIFWIAENLLKKEGMPDVQKEDVRLIKDQSRRLLATVNDLLALSAVERMTTKKLQKERIAIQPFLQELAEGSALSLKEKSLRLVFDPSLSAQVSVYGDAERLRRMFGNLISNATKYSRSGGTVTIGCSRHDARVILWVKDEGIGVPKKDQTKIFEGFYRSENAKKTTESGTGLGLRYVRQVAEMHGGSVWLESEEGSGSTFFVELPAP